MILWEAFLMQSPRDRVLIGFLVVWVVTSVLACLVLYAIHARDDLRNGVVETFHDPRAEQRCNRVSIAVFWPIAIVLFSAAGIGSAFTWLVTLGAAPKREAPIDPYLLQARREVDAITS